MKEKNKNQIAVFAGSFDPFTLGHLDIVKKAKEMFPSVVVLVADNEDKSAILDIKDRVMLAKKSLEGVLDGECVQAHRGLTTDFLKQSGGFIVVRGLRNSNDFAYEDALLQTYKSQFEAAQGAFILADPALRHISSSTVRALVRLGGDITKFVAPNTLKEIIKLYS